MIQQQIASQAKQVQEGAKTWAFWKVQTINAAVGSSASAGVTFLNNIMSGGLGMDTGDLISLKGFGIAMLLGGLLGILKVLSTFKLPQ